MQVVNTVLADRMKVIWYTWISILVLSFAYTICAFAGAVASDAKSYSFLLIWSMLMLLAFAVLATLVLRRVHLRTHLNVGALIGAAIMFVMLWLLVAVLSGANVAKWGSSIKPSSVEAVTAFSALLFIDFTLFTVFLILYRDALLPPPSMASQDSELPPPPQFSSAAPTSATYSYTSEAPVKTVDAYGVEEHVTVPTGGQTVL